MEDLTGIGTAKQKMHKLVLMGRHTSNLSGVVDVLSFDPNEILMETEQGMLMIKGNDLHVSRLNLDKGEVDVEGRVDSFTYSENTSYGNKGESILARLFK